MPATLKLQLVKKRLHFKFKAGTSRGWYETRDVAYVCLIQEEGKIRTLLGVGEAAPLPKLSPEWPQGKSFDDYVATLTPLIAQAEAYLPAWLDDPAPIPPLTELEHALRGHSALRFALETAILQAKAGSFALFDSPFARGQSAITINGLIWMGDFALMRQRIEEKLSQGFNCLKLKIGAINFKQELELLALIRQEFGAAKLTLRVDANGAFSPHEAMDKLEQLARFDLHSIEQPIKAGQWQTLAHLCKQSPIPIALDEELIAQEGTQRVRLLESVKPQFLVLKPSLHGGLSGAMHYLQLAADFKLGAWMTSALESSIGLNAIAQFIGYRQLSGFQGLGTGQLFTDNLPFPVLCLDGQNMRFDRSKINAIDPKSYLNYVP